MDQTAALWELSGLLEEYKKRQQHQFTQYKPLDYQVSYHQSEAWCRLVFGGNRSGKSRVTSQEILWWCTNSHPYQKTPEKPRIWVIAPEYRIIYEGIWLHLRNTIPYWEIEKFGSKIPGWDIPSYVKFRKGAQIDFISAEGGEADRKKLQAAEIDFVCIDEEISGDLYIELIARLLTRGGRLNISATLVNSEDWILELEQKGDDPNNTDVDVFRFSTDNNPYNNKKLLDIFLSELSPEEREVRILGRSRKAKGLYYKTGPLHRIPRTDIPLTWPRIHIFDSGHRLAAALWIAASPENKFIIYREMYLRYTELAECVNFWRIHEGWEDVGGVWVRTPKTENVTLRIIDPSDFHTQKDGSLSVGDQLFEHYGYEFIPGINNKDQNIRDVQRLLQPEMNPRLQFFDDLPNFWMEIRKYRVYERKSKAGSDEVKDRPLKRHDHLMNCMEYFASYNYQFVLPKTAKDLLIDESKKPLDQIEFSEDVEEFRAKFWRVAKLKRNRKYHRKDY